MSLIICASDKPNELLVKTGSHSLGLLQRGNASLQTVLPSDRRKCADSVMFDLGLFIYLFIHFIIIFRVGLMYPEPKVTLWSKMTLRLLTHHRSVGITSVGHHVWVYAMQGIKPSFLCALQTCRAIVPALGLVCEEPRPISDRKNHGM